MLLAAATAAMLAGSGMAQDRSGDSMDFVREKVAADKKLFIAQNLELTPPEAGAFWPVYDRFQSELLTLQERALRMVGDYITAYPNLSDETAKRLLDESLAVDAEWARLRQVFAPQFRRAVSERKVARYYQLENKIHAVVSYDVARVIPLVK
jgi:hypothetical protein